MNSLRVKNNTNFKILNIGVIFSIVGIVKSVVTTLIGVLSIAWLLPTDLGRWSSLTIIQSYLPFFHLGVQSALNRDLPILLGQNRYNEAVELVSNSKSFAFLVAFSFAIIGIVVISFLIIKGYSNIYIFGIIGITLIVISESVRIHLISTFRASNSFHTLIKLNVADIIISFSLVFFIYKYQFYGLVVYSALSAILSALLLYLFSPYRSEGFKLKSEFLINMIKSGLTLMTFSQFRIFATSIPKWIMLSFGNLRTLGIYTPASAVGGFMLMFSDQLAQFVSPQLGYMFGQTGQAYHLWGYSKKLIIVIPIISFPFAILIYFSSPFLINYFLPMYIDSLRAIQILAFGSIFGSYSLTHGVLYTIKAYRAAYFFSFLEILGYLLFPLFIIYFSRFDLLVSVALGVSINLCFLYFVNAFILKHVLSMKRYNIQMNE